MPGELRILAALDGRRHDVAGTATGGISATGKRGRGRPGTGIANDPRVVADGSTTTFTQASGTLSSSSSSASIAISAHFGGA